MLHEGSQLSALTSELHEKMQTVHATMVVAGGTQLCERFLICLCPRIF